MLRLIFAIVVIALLGGLLFFSSYAKVVLDDPHGRQPTPAERRLAYLALLGAALCLSGALGSWWMLR